VDTRIYPYLSREAKALLCHSLAVGDNAEDKKISTRNVYFVSENLSK